MFLELVVLLDLITRMVTLELVVKLESDQEELVPLLEVMVVRVHGVTVQLLVAVAVLQVYISMEELLS